MPQLPDYAYVLILSFVLLSPFVPLYFIGRYLERLIGRHRRRPTRHHSPPPGRAPAIRQPPPQYELSKRELDPRASQLKAMLLTLYEPKHDFLLGVTDLRPRTLMGYYTTHPYCRITVHSGWRCNTEVSIHEFAHHLAFTELPCEPGKKIRVHGREFKTVYSLLIDAYNRRYPTLSPDDRYYLSPDKRIKRITFNLKT